jgi:hypothetical protein
MERSHRSAFVAHFVVAREVSAQTQHTTSSVVSYKETTRRAEHREETNHFPHKHQDTLIGQSVKLVTCAFGGAVKERIRVQWYLITEESCAIHREE